MSLFNNPIPLLVWVFSTLREVSYLVLILINSRSGTKPMGSFALRHKELHWRFKFKYATWVPPGCTCICCILIANVQYACIFISSLTQDNIYNKGWNSYTNNICFWNLMRPIWFGPILRPYVLEGLKSQASVEGEAARGHGPPCKGPSTVAAARNGA